MTTAATVSCEPKTVSAAQAKRNPKEHGAYAILAVPLATGLIITGPTIVGLAATLAAVAGFLSHEPLLVVMGYRGARARQTFPFVRQRLAVLLIVMLASGLAALWLGPMLVRWSLIGCAMLASISFSVACLGKHRTLTGQLLGVVSLSAPLVPVLLAGQRPLGTSIESWVTLAIGFTSTTVAVRGVIATQKRQPCELHFTILGAISVIIGGLVATGYSLVWATLPMLCMSWSLLLRPPPTRYLKRVGWTLVGGTLASAIWLLVIF
ncbi:MAG: YwiC-like family protein [Planctomycetota bacterium]